MSQFTENISIQPLPKLDLWVTTKPLIYYIGSEESREFVEVPTGYVFDGASVPMLFGWMIQRVEPRTISAAAVHDYLYTDNRVYGRMGSDLIFHEALLVCGVSRAKAALMYLGVLLGGWLYWYKFI